LLQAAHSHYQIGAFENFHELVEDMLIVLRPGPKVFFQYELRFVNRLKSQLLISHLFFPIKEMPSGREKEARNQAAFWEISPPFLDYPINFYFNGGGLQRPIAALPGSTRFRSSLASSNGRRARAGAFREVRCGRRFSEVGRSPT
jgi:hypothetical protein